VGSQLGKYAKCLRFLFCKVKADNLKFSTQLGFGDKPVETTTKTQIGRCLSSTPKFWDPYHIKIKIKFICFSSFIARLHSSAGDATATETILKLQM